MTDLEAPTPGSDADPVPWATFIAVEKGIVRDRVPPAEYETYAETHGVPRRRLGKREGRLDEPHHVRLEGRRRVRQGDERRSSGR